MTYEHYMDIAIKAATRAGDYLLERSCVEATVIEGKDIKLFADKQSENIIIDELSKTGIQILSEESVSDIDKTELCWIIDPLDGSMNYYRDMTDLTCVSIALWHGNAPILGVVNRFAAGELFTGIVGGNAALNGTPIKTSSVKQASQAILATGFPVKRDYSAGSLSDFVKNVQNYKKMRMLGTAATMAVFVACGRLDIYAEEDIMIWDVAAAIAIVTAAGGSVYYRDNGNNKCVCLCSATKELMEGFNVKSI